MNVIIGQYDCIQNITGEFTACTHDTVSPIATGAFKSLGGSYRPGGSAGGGMWGLSFDASRVVRTGNESRSLNFTKLLWRRIN